MQAAHVFFITEKRYHNVAGSHDQQHMLARQDILVLPCAHVWAPTTPRRHAVSSPLTAWTPPMRFVECQAMRCVKCQASRLPDTPPDLQQGTELVRRYSGQSPNDASRGRSQARGPSGGLSHLLLVRSCATAHACMVPGHVRVQSAQDVQGLSRQGLSRTAWQGARLLALRLKLAPHLGPA